MLTLHFRPTVAVYLIPLPNLEFTALIMVTWVFKMFN